MIGLKVKIIDETKNVEKAVEKASFENLGHAGASIRRKAIASIEKSDKASPAGSPPHTRIGELRKAISFDVEDKSTAVIGPRASAVGQVGAAQEFGGRYKGGDFPKRPFMGPALEESLDRFHESWRGSVHS
jgi:phage gpG-like protein